MNTATVNPGYKKGFIPFALAAAVLSLCGGFTAAVPAVLVADWGMDSTLTAWVALAYALGAAAMAPIMGKLGDVLGRRHTILLGLAIFGIGQLLIGLAPTGNLALVLVFRFIVGAGAAAISPVVMSYIMTRFPQEKIGRGFSIYMLLASSMVVFGPTLGGVVIRFVGWRPILYICFGLIAIVFVLCLALAKRETGEKKTLAGFDITGSILVLIFFSMVLSIPTFGQNNGWTSIPTIVCVIVGVVSLNILVQVERHAANPVLSGRFMARRQFVLPILILFLSQGLLQSCMTNIIVFVMYTQGDATLSGIATSVMYVGMAIGAIVIGPMADKWEPRIIAPIALLFVAVGAALQITFTATTGLFLFSLALFLIGLGLGGNSTIFMKVALSGLSHTAAGSGSGTYNVFRDLSTPFGVALFVPMFTAAMSRGIADGLSSGLDEAAAIAQAGVSSLHHTARIQVFFLAAGIIVGFMLPKIHSKAQLTP